MSDIKPLMRVGGPLVVSWECGCRTNLRVPAEGWAWVHDLISHRTWIRNTEGTGG